MVAPVTQVSLLMGSFQLPFNSPRAGTVPGALQVLNNSVKNYKPQSRTKTYYSILKDVKVLCQYLEYGFESVIIFLGFSLSVK